MLFGYIDYRYFESTDPTPFLIVSAVAAVLFSILLAVLVLPEKRRPKLGAFLRGLADIFNFKSLLVEKILKFLYMVSTIFVVVFGFCTLFMEQYGESLALRGLLMIVAGPIALRLSFELLMMAVLLVKNVIDINKKLSAKTETPAPVQVPAPVQMPPVAEVPQAAEASPVGAACPVCGTLRDSQGGAFCPVCGLKYE